MHYKIFMHVRDGLQKLVYQSLDLAMSKIKFPIFQNWFQLMITVLHHDKHLLKCRSKYYFFNIYQVFVFQVNQSVKFPQRRNREAFLFVLWFKFYFFNSINLTSLLVPRSKHYTISSFVNHIKMLEFVNWTAPFKQAYFDSFYLDFIIKFLDVNFCFPLHLFQIIIKIIK